MKKLFLLFSLSMLARDTFAGINYRWYEKTTENGGVNGYDCVSETRYNTTVTLEAKTYPCQMYVLDCSDPGNSACVFSQPPYHFSLPTVDQFVIAQINTGHYAGQIYLNGSPGPGDANNFISPLDMPSYLWATDGTTTKIAIIDFENEQ